MSKIICPHCGGDRLHKHGKSPHGEQRYRCPKCQKAFIPGAVVKGNNCWIEPGVLKQLKSLATAKNLTLSELIKRLIEWEKSTN